jgi:hypothetical protein
LETICWDYKRIIMEFEKGKDYYLEDGRVILTERYLKKRGKCCGSGCRHCPYIPKHTKGSTELKKYGQ